MVQFPIKEIQITGENQIILKGLVIEHSSVAIRLIIKVNLCRP